MNTIDKSLKVLGYKYVIETGVDNGWDYMKWSDGTYEARKRINYGTKTFGRSTFIANNYVDFGLVLEAPLLPQNAPSQVEWQASLVSCGNGKVTCTQTGPGVIFLRSIFQSDTLSLNVTGIIVEYEIEGTWK